MAWCNFDDYNTSDFDLLTTECMNELQWSRAFFVEFESIIIAKSSDHMDVIVRSWCCEKSVKISLTSWA